MILCTMVWVTYDTEKGVLEASLRNSAEPCSSHTHASHLADVQRRVASNAEGRVLRAGRLPDGVIVDLQGKANVACDGELIPGREAHLTTSLNGTALDSHVVTVFDELLPVNHLRQVLE